MQRVPSKHNKDIAIIWDQHWSKCPNSWPLRTESLGKLSPQGDKYELLSERKGFAQPYLLPKTL